MLIKLEELILKKKQICFLILIFVLSTLFTSCKFKTKFVNRADSPKIEVEWLITDSDESVEESDLDEFDGSTTSGSVAMSDDEFAQIANSDKRVVCWGDSLTEGTGGDGVTMPNTLEELSGATVLNYGVYAEQTSCIAARQGGNPQTLVEDIVIPADCTPVKATVSGNYGYEMLLVFGNAGINNVTLGGIEGTYEVHDDANRYFTRLTPGEETPLPAGTQLFTHGMTDKRDDDILVIWAGGNDTPNSEEEFQAVFKKIDEMIEYQGCTRYIVISDMNPHARIPLTDEFNEAFKNKYGEHFLDLRSYMINDALDQLGITPTDADKAAVEKGDIPVSLRMASDDENEVHGNSHYYRIAGEQVYKKLQELGYLQ